jgi:hypothetical protein
MALGGHTRTAVWAAAGILFVGGAISGCGSGGGGEEGSPTPTTRSAGPTRTNQPSDPAAAEKQIKDNWEKFFSSSTPIDQKVKYLENGDRLRPVLQRFNIDRHTRGVAAEVKKVAFTSPAAADVTYTLTFQEATQLPNVVGFSVLQDNVWKVSVKTFCGLLQLSGGQTPVPGC